ncbi:plasmid mobilization protein [Facklamia sp. P12932]|uniref:plasmid mobilization protein n=1 Tax=Facklamia sp. P12932 TaxID=3421947 RepID=UPI003D1645B7
MENRRRKNQLKIWLDDEELALFKKKLEMSKCNSIGQFIRKSILEKEIYVVDLEPIVRLDWLFSNATNNINQIAKHTNQTGVIYHEDIKSIRKDLDNFSKELWQIHSLLLGRTKERSD